MNEVQTYILLSLTWFLYRQRIVSEVETDILLSLTWFCIDRELSVKLRHLTIVYLALYRQGIESKAQWQV